MLRGVASGGGGPRVPATPLGFEKQNLSNDYFGSFHLKKDLNMKNENVPDLKSSRKELLSELKISYQMNQTIQW